MISGGAVSGHGESFLHDGAHAALVNVAHGENLNSGFADVLFFEVIDIADADEDTIFRRHFWRKIVNLSQFSRRQAHDRGEGHAVHVATGRRLGRVHIGVSINPDQADFLFFAAVEFGDA